MSSKKRRQKGEPQKSRDRVVLRIEELEPRLVLAPFSIGADQTLTLGTDVVVSLLGGNGGTTLSGDYDAGLNQFDALTLTNSDANTSAVIYSTATAGSVTFNTSPTVRWTAGPEALGHLVLDGNIPSGFSVTVQDNGSIAGHPLVDFIYLPQLDGSLTVNGSARSVMIGALNGSASVTGMAVNVEVATTFQGTFAVGGNPVLGPANNNIKELEKIEAANLVIPIGSFFNRDTATVDATRDWIFDDTMSYAQFLSAPAPDGVPASLTISGNVGSVIVDATVVEDPVDFYAFVPRPGGNLSITRTAGGQSFSLYDFQGNLISNNTGNNITLAIPAGTTPNQYYLGVRGSGGEAPYTFSILGLEGEELGQFRAVEDVGLADSGAGGSLIVGTPSFDADVGRVEFDANWFRGHSGADAIHISGGLGTLVGAVDFGVDPTAGIPSNPAISVGEDLTFFSLGGSAYNTDVTVGGDGRYFTTGVATSDVFTGQITYGGSLWFFGAQSLGSAGTDEAPARPGSLSVGGDLPTVLLMGDFNSGDIYVGGNANSVGILGNDLGSVTVIGNPAAPSPSYTELEVIRNPNLLDGPSLTDQPPFIPTDAFLAVQETTNDSMDTSQFLAAPAPDGSPGSLTISGSLQTVLIDTTVVTDNVDYYSFVANKGSALTITRSAGSAQLLLFDIYGNFVAAGAGNTLTVPSVENSSQFYLQVTGSGNYTLNISGVDGEELGLFSVTGDAGTNAVPVDDAFLTIGDATLNPDADTGRIDFANWYEGGVEATGSLAVFLTAGDIGVLNSLDTPIFATPQFNFGGDSTVMVAIGGSAYTSNLSFSRPALIGFDGNVELFGAVGDFEGDIVIGGNLEFLAVGSLSRIVDGETGALLHVGGLSVGGYARSIIVHGDSGRLISVGQNANYVQVDGGMTGEVIISGNPLMADPVYPEREVIRPANDRIPIDGLIAFQTDMNDVLGGSSCLLSEFLSSPSGNFGVIGELSHWDTEALTFTDTADWYAFGAHKGAVVTMTIGNPDLLLNIYNVTLGVYAGDPTVGVSGEEITLTEDGIFFAQITRTPDAAKPANLSPEPYTLVVTGADQEIAGRTSIAGQVGAETIPPGGFISGNITQNGDSGAITLGSFLDGSISVLDPTPGDDDAPLNGDLMVLAIAGSVGVETSSTSITIDGNLYDRIEISGDNWADMTIAGDANAIAMTGTFYGALTVVGSANYLRTANMYGGVDIGVDLHRFIVVGDTGIVPDFDPVEPPITDYVTDNDSHVSVGRNLDYYAISGLHGAPLTVGGDDSGAIDQVYNEVENIVTITPNCWLNPSLFSSTASTNDTADAAEPISSPNGLLVINGRLQVTQGDWIDNYNFLGYAGQTITIVPDASVILERVFVLPPPMWYAVGLFDTQGTLVASNMQNLYGQPAGFQAPEGFTGTPIVWTLPETGVYRIAVSEAWSEISYGQSTFLPDWVDPNIDGSTHSDLEPEDLIDFAYRLHVSGLGKQTLGAMSVGSYQALTGGISLAVGDIGRLGIGTWLLSAGVDVAIGNIGYLQTGDWGFLRDPNHFAPAVLTTFGDVYRIDAANVVTAYFDAGGDIGAANFSGAFGSDLQAGMLFTAGMAPQFMGANGSIGIVSIGGSFNYGYIMADADSSVNVDGNPGNIDVIEIGGGYADPAFGLDSPSPALPFAQILTTAGADVRFVNVGGFVEGKGAQTFSFPQNSSATVIDDSGSQIVFGLNPGASVSYKQVPIYGFSGTGGVHFKGYAISSLSISGNVSIRGVDGGTFHTLNLNGNPLNLTTSSVTNSNPRFDVYQLGGVLSEFSIDHGSVGVVNVAASSAGVFRQDFTIQGGILNIKDGNIGLLTGLGGNLWLNGNVYVPPGTLPAGTYAGFLNGMMIAGDMWSISASGYIGNIFVTGNLHTVNFNTDHQVTAVPFGRQTPFEGLSGVLYASGNIDQLELNEGGLLVKEAFVDSQGIARVRFRNTAQNADIGVFSDGMIKNITDSGPGPIAFDPARDYVVGKGLNSVVTADFNGDGVPDLAVVNSLSNSVSIFIGTGAGAFQSPWTYLVGSNPGAVAVGDFNGDGEADLAVANRGGNSLSILLGNGDGSFVSAGDFFVGRVPTALAAADFNGDGLDDLAVTLSNENRLLILQSTGGGGFVPSASFTIVSIFGDPYFDVPMAIAAGDFDQDGNLDLAVAGVSFNAVYLFFGDGAGDFTPPGAADIYTVGTGPVALAAADFNADGLLDLAVADAFSNKVTMLVGAAGGFNGAQTQTLTVLLKPQGLTAADFDGDGVLDLAVSNSGSDSVRLVLGKVSGAVWSTKRAEIIETGSSPMGIVGGDFNGDGALDLVVANYDSNNLSFIQQKTIGGLPIGHFREGVFFSASQTPSSVALGDLNGDGYMDMAVLNRDAGNLAIYLGTVAGYMNAPVATYAVGTNASDLLVAAPADLDGDGFIDILSLDGDVVPDIVVSVAGEDKVLIFFGFGDGTFATPLETDLPAGSNPSALAASAFDSDAFPDIAVTLAGSNQVAVLLSFSGWAYNAGETFAVGASPADIVAGDLNADGNADLVVANSGNNTVGVLLGNGDGTFQAQAAYVVGQTPVAVVLGDFTADGVTDIATVNNGDNTVSVLKGLGAGAFSTYGVYKVGNSPTAAAAADLDADGIPDLIVTNSADNTVSGLRGADKGGFLRHVVIPVGQNPLSVALGFVDYDGRPDMVVAQAGDNNVGVYIAWANDIQGPVVASGAMPEFIFPNSHTIAIDKLTVSDGARLEAPWDYGRWTLIQGGPFADWQWFSLLNLQGTYMPTSSLGSVVATGPGSQINLSWILGDSVRKVSSEDGANGIFNTNIGTARVTFSDTTISIPGDNTVPLGSIVLVQAGGFGLYNVNIQASNTIHTIQTTEPAADIFSVGVESNRDLIEMISARDITGTPLSPTRITIWGKTRKVVAERTVNYFTYNGSELGVLQAVNGDLLNLNVQHAGRMTLLSAHGQITGSIQALGPSGRIDTIYAGGDVNADIYVWGMIQKMDVGRLNPVNGTLTIANPNAVLKKLTLRGGGGGLNIAASIGTLISYGDLRDISVGRTLNSIQVIGGNLTGYVIANNTGGAAVAIGKIQVKGGNLGAPGDALEITAGSGNVSQIIVAASLAGVASGGYANVDINIDGVLGKLLVTGNGVGLSGVLDGTIDAFGIGTITVTGGTQINADITVTHGGNVKTIENKGSGGIGGIIDVAGTIGTIKTAKGDITANITANGSASKAIKLVSAGGGSIIGDVTAANGGIGQLSATADVSANIGGEIQGNIYANGPIAKITTVGTPGPNTTGDISGNIVADSIGTISVVNGNISGTIQTLVGAIKGLSAKGGSITANVSSQTDIGSLSTQGGGIGFFASLSNLSLIMAGGSINSINAVGGDISGGFDAGAEIGNIGVKADASGLGGNMTNASVAAGNIGVIRVAGNLINTDIVASVRPGPTEGTIGGVFVGGMIFDTGGSYYFLADNGTFTVEDLFVTLIATSSPQSIGNTLIQIL